jgi:hypothetical protein
MPHNRTIESAERAAVRRQASRDAEATAEAHEPTPHPLVQLQRQIGNAQIARMLAQRDEGEEEEVQAKHDPLQREESEEEELQAKHAPLQREEGEEEEVQAKHEGAAPTPEVGLEGGPISDGLSARINSKRGGGATLDAGTRAEMEAGFGADFGDVRVHTDAESDALNRSISARAFTTGSDVFFRSDASPGDRQLLAHELTHVVQQRSGGAGGTGMQVGPAGDASEHEADAVAQAVSSGQAAQAQRAAEEEQAQRRIAREEAAEEEQAEG